MSGASAPRKFVKPPPPRPAPIGASSPDARDAITATTLGVDQCWRDYEAKWGVGRLPLLVTDATRASMRRGMDAWNAAITAGDVAAVQTIGPKIKAALAFMDAEAVAGGNAPLSPVVWEVRRDDGSVIAITRTGAEASAVLREGRDIEVWTLEEIARVLPRLIGDIKRHFPGATVEQPQQHSAAYAMEWQTADTALAEIGL